MENISYFCNVKHFKHIYITLMLLALCVSVTLADDNNVTSKELTNSTKHVSLLTCDPGKEVYSLYGHTAVRYQDTAKGIDIAINYGMFSFNKPFFILRFIFGLTDYEMGVFPYERFMAEYRFTQRGVFEQELNLTDEEKERFITAVEENYLPQNRTYRYNYLYDNCTTRARDIIMGCLDKTKKIKFIQGTVSVGNPVSYRDMIHLYNEDYPWARFGNDLLLGLKADLPINKTQQQFLPENLKADFQNAVIQQDGRDAEPFVIKSQWTFSPFKSADNQTTIMRPITCSLILLAISIIITVAEIKRKKFIWLFDLILMLVTGIAGIIIFLMLFSQHPTTSLNLQILLLNPIPLFFVWHTIRRSRLKQKDNYWLFIAVCILLFLAGNLLQNYAEGMNIVALALATRCFSHIYNTVRNEK